MYPYKARDNTAGGIRGMGQSRDSLVRENAEHINHAGSRQSQYKTA